MQKHIAPCPECAEEVLLWPWLFGAACFLLLAAAAAAPDVAPAAVPAWAVAATGKGIIDPKAPTRMLGVVVRGPRFGPVPGSMPAPLPVPTPVVMGAVNEKKGVEEALSLS